MLSSSVTPPTRLVVGRVGRAEDNAAWGRISSFGFDLVPPSPHPEAPLS